MSSVDTSTTPSTSPSDEGPGVDGLWERLLGDFEDELAGVAADLARGRVPQPRAFTPPPGPPALPPRLQERARAALDLWTALVDDLVAAVAATRAELQNLKTERHGRPQAAFVDDRV